jgi:thioredoxin 1
MSLTLTVYITNDKLYHGGFISLKNLGFTSQNTHGASVCAVFSQTLKAQLSKYRNGNQLIVGKWRFRKSLKIAPGIRLNLASGSVGVSAGIKGARVGINSKNGAYSHLSIPGTGLYRRTYHKVASSDSLPLPSHEVVKNEHKIPPEDAIMYKIGNFFSEIINCIVPKKTEQECSVSESSSNITSCQISLQTMALVHISGDQFSQELLKNDLPVAAYFWSPSSKPCMYFTPVVHKIAQDYAGRAKIVAINTDEAMQLVEEYKILATPCLILFKEGVEIDRIINFVPEKTITAMLDRHIENPSNFVSGYCVNCKGKREMKDLLQTTMQDGRLGIQGKCNICQSPIFKIGILKENQPSKNIKNLNMTESTSAHPTAEVIMNSNVSVAIIHEQAENEVKNFGTTPTFAKIPWGSDPTSVQNSLTSVGYEYVETDSEGDMLFHGIVLGYPSHIRELFSVDRELAKTAIFVKAPEPDCRETYNEAVRVFEEKYGKRKFQFHNYEYPYNDGTGDQYFDVAMNNGKAKFASGWGFSPERSTGGIVINICRDLTICISYESGVWEDVYQYRQNVKNSDL